MTGICGPDLFYVAAAILVGSGIINYLLTFIKIDVRPFLSTKQVKALQRRAVNISELFLRPISVSDPLSTPHIPASLSSRGYLETLPPRSGSRPSISGISNLRQKTQLPSSEKEVPLRLQDLITNVCSCYPQATYLGRSTFEPEGPIALYARHRIYNDTKYYGLILCADRTEGLMQIALHPGDVKTVIEKGWGQRHPLASRPGSWLLRLFSDEKPSPVAESRVLLYAPRDQTELEVLQHVINAAVWWVGGIDNTVDVESY